MARAIDADELIKKAWDADTRIGYVQVVDVGDIEEAPTIDPVNHGKWEKNTDGMHFCSECCSDATHFWNGAEVLGNFCTFCGARMDGDSE